jgi:hypothetical protein
MRTPRIYNVIIDRPGLLGNVSFIGVQNSLDHRWNPISLVGAPDARTVIGGCCACSWSPS